MRSIDEARAYQKQERSRDNSELWEAVMAAHEAIIALGGPGLPELHVNRARANLIRAGISTSGDFTDTELNKIATADGTRCWSADMGTIFQNEPIVGEDGEIYIALQMHEAQAGWGPGTEGGRTLFRLLRKEPEETGKAGKTGKAATKNTAKKEAKAAKQEPEEKPLTLEEVRAVLAEKEHGGQPDHYPETEGTQSGVLF